MNETIRFGPMRQNAEKTSAGSIPIPSVHIGLTESEAEASRRLHGSNAMTVKKQAGFFRQFLSNLNDPIIKILIAALVINTAFTFSHINWAETIGIGLTVLI